LLFCHHAALLRRARSSGYASFLRLAWRQNSGNLTFSNLVFEALAGPVSAQYNIMNLPTKLTTDAGTRYFGYVYGAGKYSARIEATPSDNPIEETRHYLGGIEFVDGKPETDKRRFSVAKFITLATGGSFMRKVCCRGRSFACIACPD